MRVVQGTRTHTHGSRRTERPLFILCSGYVQGRRRSRDVHSMEQLALQQPLLRSLLFWRWSAWTSED